jgi:hypothetical protein
MRYKKLRPVAIMPLWAKIIMWIVGIYCTIFFIMLIWLCVSFVANEISNPYAVKTSMKLLFVSVNTFNMDNVFMILMFLAILLPIFCVLAIPFPFYIIKFYSHKFSLSDIKNPEKYNPEDIRKYFPGYLSKKEKEQEKQDSEKELKKAADIINKQIKEFGEDKVMSMIKGLK